MTIHPLVFSSDITVAHLLDRTGSMYGTEKQVVEAINLFLKKMQADSKGGKANFILRQFDSMGFDNLREGLMGDIRPVEVQEYKPRALTPLFDAIVDIIKIVESGGTNKNMLVIQTDGLENSSKKYQLADVKKLIEQKRKDGWIVIYLGANIDSWKQAEDIGIPNQHALNYKQGEKEIPNQANSAQPWSKFGKDSSNNPLAYALGTIALLGLGYLLLSSNDADATSVDQLEFDEVDRNASMAVTGVGDDTWQNAVSEDVAGFVEPVNSVFDLTPDLAEQHAQLPEDFDPASGSLVDDQSTNEDGHEESDRIGYDDDQYGRSENVSDNESFGDDYFNSDDSFD
ncbi:MAG: hypothetical protein R3B60_04240 [Candidatus Paceibacterota bacterium]